MNVAVHSEAVREAPRPLLLAWLPVVAVALWWGIWFGPDIAAMAGIWWRSGTFAHGMVVAPIAIWLAMRERFWGRGLIPSPSLRALPFLAMAGVGWLAGHLLLAASVIHIAVVALLVFALWGALGDRLARLLAFPLGFLFFAPPVGEFLVPTMMHYTAEFTVSALRATGVPVFQEGLHFVLPNGRWSVVEACSGVRYLIASLMVGTLYAYLTYTGVKKRLIFVAMAVLLPIVANWVRAYLIVLLGYVSNNELAVGVDHLIYGWVFFGALIMAMFWIGNRWRDDEPPLPAPVTAPVLAYPTSCRIRLLVLFALLALWPLVATRALPEAAEINARVQLPSAGSGWQVRQADLGGYAPSFTGYRARAEQGYVSGEGGEIGLWTMLYANQVEGHEMVSWDNRVRPADKKRWGRLEQGSAKLSIGTIAYERLRGKGIDVLAYHWYVIGDTVVTGDIAAKLLMAGRLLLGRGDAGLRVVLATRDDGPAAVERVEAFLRERGAELTEGWRTSLASLTP